MQSLQVIGSWNDWYVPGIPLEVSADDPPWQVARVDLPPGEYGYLILEDGVHRVDPHNPLSTFWREQDDLEVSLLRVGDCSEPRVVVDAVATGPTGELSLAGRFEAAAPGGRLAAAELRTAEGAVIPAEIEAESGTIAAGLSGLPRGKHSLELVARDEDGREARARAIGWVQPTAERREDTVLYQVVIDRFRGPGGAALASPASPGGRAGGTLGGVLAELEAGTFEALGASTLWLSPVYVNPIEPREGRGDGHMYEGYHGYWPEQPREVDARIGGAAELRALVRAAHARGLGVLLDLVPNHVYEASPRYLQSTDASMWNTSDPPCVCGIGSCDWATHIQTCWFTDYLPDLRLQHPEALRWTYEDAVWWMREYDADGVRIDAVPMMPRAATRRIAAEIRESAAPRDSHFLVGEVYTGPGAWGIDVIRYYIGPDGLDSVFDFPSMWAIRDALAHGSAGFTALEAVLADVEAKTAGSGAVLARMIGNHDTTRFASEAAGDAGGDPWASPPPQPAEPEVYARQGLALGLVLTLPGAPVIYYGDELGLAGATDPDCRRVMPGEEALRTEQIDLREQVRRLGQLRRCSPALRRGGRTPVVVEDDVYAFVRAAEGQAALVLLSRAGEARALAVPGMSLEPGSYVDALTGDAFEIGAGATDVMMAPRSLRVLLPAGDPCLVP